MLRNLKNKIRKNIQIIGLIFLITITVVSTSYFNYKKESSIQAYNNFIDNIYFKKTLRHLVDNLEPKYKKIKHKVQSGETF
ncbi:peptidase M23, partial [Candidatus Pelagibacter sp.]|nr:peptidase M23 [Candidatus Pelagibacter sp.]